MVYTYSHPVSCTRLATHTVCIAYLTGRGAHGRRHSHTGRKASSDRGYSTPHTHTHAHTRTHRPVARWLPGGTPPAAGKEVFRQCIGAQRATYLPMPHRWVPGGSVCGVVRCVYTVMVQCKPQVTMLCARTKQQLGGRHQYSSSRLI